MRAKVRLESVNVMVKLQGVVGEEYMQSNFLPMLSPSQLILFRTYAARYAPRKATP